MSKAAAHEIRFLDPKKLEVAYDAFDHLRLTIDGDEVHERVKAARAFPTSCPDRFVAFQSHDGREIGVVEEPARLDPSSRRVLDETLAMVYYHPSIRRIAAVKSKHGATTWEVETDRGPATIYVKDRGDARRMPGRRVLFTDVHGVKYDIPDYHQLDDRSRSLLENEV